MTANEPKTTTDRIEKSVAAVEEAAGIVEEAASRVESNVLDGIQPDITEIRMDFSEMSEATNVRVKRLTWAIWALAIANFAVLLLLVVRGN